MPVPGDIQEIIIFHVGNMLCGIPITQVQEINKQLEITTVRHAPAYVRGVLNLRGQIVTVIDLGTKLGFAAQELSEDTQIMIVRLGEESLGLLVDKVQDVLLADARDIAPPPAHVQGASGTCVTGIYKMDDGLVTLLNIEALLAYEPLEV